MPKSRLTKIRPSNYLQGTNGWRSVFVHTAVLSLKALYLVQAYVQDLCTEQPDQNNHVSAIRGTSGPAHSAKHHRADGRRANICRPTEG